MALKVKRNLTLIGGLPIEQNSVISIKFESIEREDKFEIKLSVWSSIENYNDKSKPKLADPVVEIEKYSWIKDLTENDFSSLSPLAVHQLVIEEIESWDASWINKLEII